MVSIRNLNVWIILLIIQQISAIPYNQPKFSECATWSINGTTFANVATVGSQPYGIYINSNNTVYVADQVNNRIQIWLNNNTSPTRTISVNISMPYSIFATSNGDMYIDTGKNSSACISKRKSNGSITSTVMYSGQKCFGIFIDINDTLYCSMRNVHQVVARSLNSVSEVLSVAAGIGCPGSSAEMLYLPSGIYVNTNFDLYVADCGNNRIQLFQSDPLNGTTIDIYGPVGTITLNCPTGIALDADSYLYIVDSGNQRIIGSGPSGFLCRIGCSGTSGSAANQLNIPWSLSFDSYGNIFVADQGNNRIQKFALATNSCVCRAPTVIPIPGTSTLASPIQYTRSQDFFIISVIEINCNQSVATTIQWTVRNCTTICSNQIPLNPTISTTLSELYIPARTLAYGIYELKLTVTMTLYSWLTTSVSVYITITPSGITANMIQFGTSMVTSGYEQNFLLDPGSYSVDPDSNVFNGSNWKYQYFCRIYGLYMFPNFQGSLLTIDDPRIDPTNPSCLSNRTDNQTGWQFNNVFGSSVTIRSKSLQSNRTYQFMVYMENRRNSSRRATGYVLVNVGDSRPQMIVIGCVIFTMCVPNLEFQLVNPTTQVALFALCAGNCSTIQSIKWNVYSGISNGSSNYTKWNLFNQTTAYENIWFFGTRTTNFTATNKLFLSNPSIKYWQFEVVFTFASLTSTSALNFVINQPPFNGSCSISPFNGTTSDVFTISCPNWFDADGIKDYSFYTWTTDPSQRTLTAFSSAQIFQARLPAGDDLTSTLHIAVAIRDRLDCITEYNMSSITVVPDSVGINDLINSIQNSPNQLASNPIVQLLASGDQNIVGQVVTSLAQQYNKMNAASLDKAVSSGIPAASISISTLWSQGTSGSLAPLNQSAMDEFNQELNSQANVREYTATFTSNLAITTSSSIILQASSLAQLTKSTNQLTRTTLMIVANRCYQLSVALSEMYTKIAYEAAQTAATQLIQCATNILSAVNGPLQQRTNTLDSDSLSASILPDDYETDIEFPWANPNLFVYGNDFSAQSINKGRNTYYQKQLANQIETQVQQIISLLTSTLNIHLNVGQNSSMNTAQVYMSLETTSAQSLANKQIANSQIRFPSNFQASLSQQSTISIRSTLQPLAPYGNSMSVSNTNVSTSISLTILDQNQNEIPIQTNSSQPIEILIPRDPNRVIPSMSLQNALSANATPNNQLFQLYHVDLTSDLGISVHLEIEPLNFIAGYLLIYKFDQMPQLNSSINQIDGWTLLCNESFYTYFLDNQQTSNHQSVIFGLRELNSSDCLNSSSNTPPITDQRYNFTSNFQMRIYTSGCYYLDSNNQWKSDGLRVGPLTNHNQTQCFANHLTTFAGGFLVLPAPVNWNYVFSHADFMQNKTIYLTVICISTIYLILLIYARWRDKKDLEKLGVTPLPDNHRSDGYFYQILVFTGQRKNAGTKSKVHFIISGEKDETGVRTFADPHRRILQRGGIDAFIMAVPKSLGFLNCIRIWHDNTGGGASSSWFLKYIIIRDLQTMEKFHFISQQWFAVEQGDGKIERVIPVAGVMEKNEFSYLLSKRTYHSVSDGHLWFSIFSRPPSNHFTRVQRCTCCFVLLFLSMFLSIMYYDAKQEADSAPVGAIPITPEQIGVGVIVEVLSLIPSLLLVQIFRRLRSRRDSMSPLRRTLYQIKPTPIRENVVEEPKKKKKFARKFPWWFIFIAYGLCVILVGISILFIIARGIQFGDFKTQKWLISILSGFFSSILLTQPLKIVALAIFFTCFCRKTDDDKEASEYLEDHQLELGDDEEYLGLSKDQSLFTYRPPKRINRLNEAEIACARRRRLKEVTMWSILRETSTYLTFLTFLFILTYSNQNFHAYYQVDHLTKYFQNSRSADLDYMQISTIDDYWQWLKGSFVSNLRAQQWYNGDSPRNLSGYINDKTNRMIGWATMRQLRIKSDSCHVQISNVTTCEYDYSFFDEERNSFIPGWENETQIKSNSTIDQAFQYKTKNELDTYVYQGYNGGGYVYEFRGRLPDIQSNLSELHRLSWIDPQTRAIIIQISLFNPNTELFTSIIFLTEFSSAGGAYPESQIDPMNFYAFTSVLQMVSLIIYMMFILYFMFAELCSFTRLKFSYFYEFWSWIELGIIICSWMGVGIYAWRYHEYNRISQLFKETNGYVYINLQLASYVNNFLRFIYGFCCFFGTIKLIRLCRFDQRVSLFIRVFQDSSRTLVSFGIMFSIIFGAFVCLFYLLFQSSLLSCSTALQTAAMLFEMLLMNFDAHGLSGAAPFLGPFSLSLFIFLVVFVCMSMFLSIIYESFHRAKESFQSKEDEDIYLFMFERFLRWTGLKKQTEEEIHEERDAMMRTEYHDPVERFPDKIDQLLNALNRLYMSQRNARPTI